MRNAIQTTTNARDVSDQKVTTGCGQFDIQELRHQLVELQTHMTTYTQRVVRVVAVLDIEEPDGSRTRLLATAGANMTPAAIGALLVSGLSAAGGQATPQRDG